MFLVLLSLHRVMFYLSGEFMDVKFFNNMVYIADGYGVEVRELKNRFQLIDTIYVEGTTKRLYVKDSGIYVLTEEKNLYFIDKKKNVTLYKEGINGFYFDNGEEYYFSEDRLMHGNDTLVFHSPIKKIALSKGKGYILTENALYTIKNGKTLLFKKGNFITFALSNDGKMVALLKENECRVFKSNQRLLKVIGDVPRGVDISFVDKDVLLLSAKRADLMSYDLRKRGIDTLTELHLQGNPSQLYVKNEKVFLCSDAGIYLFHYRNKDKRLFEKGRIERNAKITAGFILNKYLYTLSQDSRFFVYRIEDSTVSFIRERNLKATANMVRLNLPLVYFFKSNHFARIKMEDLEDPAHKGIQTLHFEPVDISAVGRNATAAAGWYGVYINDACTCGPFTEKSEYKGEGYAASVSVSPGGRFVAACFRDKGIDILDILDREHPQRIKQITIPIKRFYEYMHKEVWAFTDREVILYKWDRNGDFKEVKRMPLFVKDFKSAQISKDRLIFLKGRTILFYDKNGALKEKIDLPFDVVYYYYNDNKLFVSGNDMSYLYWIEEGE